MPENYTDLRSGLPYLHYSFRRRKNVAFLCRYSLPSLKMGVGVMIMVRRAIIESHMFIDIFFINLLESHLYNLCFVPGIRRQNYAYAKKKLRFVSIL